MDDLKKIIKLLEDQNKRISRIEKLLYPIGPVNTIPKQVKKSSPQSLTGLIIQLKNERFFDKPKTLKEITEKLKEQGWHYEQTSLTNPLQRLLRNRSIGRVSINGKWSYVKR